MVSPVISVGAPLVGILSVSGLRTANVRTTIDSIDMIASRPFVIIRVFLVVKFLFLFGVVFWEFTFIFALHFRFP